MPWVRANLRGQTVFARATSDGQLAVAGGKVEIRYKANDGRRYDAMASNLAIVDPTPLPDDTCGEAAKPAAAGAGTPAARGSAKTSSKGGASSKRSEVIVPEPVEGSLTVYTDGACTGNPGPAGLGVVLVEETGRKELSEYLGEGTNNIAELTAIERALDMTEGRPEPVRIHTDSKYAIGVLTKGWKAKANQSLIAGILEKLGPRRRNISIVYVPGHAGVPLNERADELARMAIKTRQTRREQV
ncbi:MAG: ribonuclease HI [Polyangiaceae bacterium]|nr:ribonuclease HI [Polyangiaceae bacterium]